MHILNFKSVPKKTPFAFECDYFIAEDNIKEKINIDNLKTLILSREKEVIESYPYTYDWNTGLGDDSMTSRADNFNLLKIPEAFDLKQIICDEYNKFMNGIHMIPENEIYVQCWSNILRKGQQIKRHRHWPTCYAYLCGHICVQQENTNTNYIHPYSGEIYSSINESGKFTLFPAWMEHYTDVHQGEQERITIAFDIITDITFNERVIEKKKNHWIKILN
jgi:hypothetical protein